MFKTKINVEENSDIYRNIMKAKREYNVEQHICDYIIDDIKAWLLAQ